MKQLATFLLFLISFYGFSQEETNSIYFPQEQLIHPDCEGATDKNACLKDIIGNELTTVLTKAINQIKIEKDTIKGSIFLDVDDNGVLDKDSNGAFVNDSILRNVFSEELKNIGKKLPQLQIQHKKPAPYISTHRLYFEYLIQESDNTKILLPILNDKNIYTGGNIFEVPVFPGCEKNGNQNLRLCFNKKMQNHIRRNFRYPKKAQKKGIQGKVNIIFTIDKTGDVTNIKTKGPHKILEAEAIRIVKLLPKLEPGLQNGKSVRVPFSIPINFRLQ